MGALSVVICAILSHFFLNERLTLFGWIGCFQCIVGSIIIALNAPQQQSVSTISAFKSLFLAPWFLAYGGACIAVALVIIFFVAPKYGKKSMLWYISVCSLIGGISVSCTQGLGACIVTTVRGENQVKYLLSSSKDENGSYLWAFSLRIGSYIFYSSLLQLRSVSTHQEKKSI